MNTPTPTYIAIIDLGSNTARMIILKTILGYVYRLDDEIREVVRLRQGMTTEGLSEKAMDRALFTLRLFQQYCHSRQISHITATATSAVREATNGKAFVQQVSRQLGLNLRILTGEEEAYYGALGALNELPITQGHVLDLGGGSLQLSQIYEGKFQRGLALSLGSLALTERFIRHDPPTEEEVANVQAEINAQLDTIPWLQPQPQFTLVGLGGTIRNLAHIEAERQHYPLYTLHGFALQREAILYSIRQFCQLSLSKRQKIAGLHDDRADIILPGAMAVATVMERLGVETVTVSMSGLREGLFFERFWQQLSYPVPANVRQFSVLNLARNYDYLQTHADHVRFLAERLFDELAPLHNYGSVERELLGAAALLHDIGTVIGYNGHHRHSQMLLEYNGLAGFSPREIALIGLLVRYHRRGQPQINQYKPLLSKKESVLLNRLASILRLTEFLERGRNSNIYDLTAQWTKNELHLTVKAHNYPAVELWEAEKHAVPLMETAFGRKLILKSNGGFQ